MKISQIEVIRLAIPFASDRTTSEVQTTAWNAASPALKRMETLLVRLTTDEGQQGWGEGFGHLCNPVTAQALTSLVIPLFLDKPVPENQEALAALMSEAEKALHAFGRSGPVRYALSAIDIALWDLLGQLSGKPLWQLLGAERREIGLYASLVSYNNQPEEVARQVQRAWQAGFLAVAVSRQARAASARQRSGAVFDRRTAPCHTRGQNRRCT